MMVSTANYVKFTDDEDNSLSVRYSNRGEPYRSGIEFCIDQGWDKTSVEVFIEEREARALRDLLNKLYPV